MASRKGILSKYVSLWGICQRDLLLSPGEVRKLTLLFALCS